MLDARRRLPVSSKTLQAYNIDYVSVNESRGRPLWKRQTSTDNICIKYTGLREEMHNFLLPTL
jgi:hypothetical protein